MNPTNNAINQTNQISIFNKFQQSIKFNYILYLFREYILTKIITTSRKASLCKIIHFLTKISVFHQLKKTVMMQCILEQRAKAIGLITRNIRSLFYIKRYKKLSKVLREFYSIFPLIPADTDWAIIWYPDVTNVNIYKKYSWNYCKLRKSFVIDIAKRKVGNQKVFYFNFMKKGNVLIDTGYKSQVIKGKCINVIDFRTKSLPEKHVPLWNSTWLSDDESEDENENEDEDEYQNIRCKDCKAHTINNVYGVEDFMSRKSTKTSSCRITNTLTNGNCWRNELKRLSTNDYSLNVKSILKSGLTRNSISGKHINQRKVMFGKVQFLN